MNKQDLKREQEKALREGRERDAKTIARVFEEQRPQIEALKARLIGLGLEIGEPVCDNRTTLVHVWVAVPIFGAKRTEETFDAAEGVAIDRHNRWVFSWRCEG